jgi:hypothetical protein
MTDPEQYCGQFSYNQLKRENLMVPSSLRACPVLDTGWGGGAAWGFYLPIPIEIGISPPR